VLEEPVVDLADPADHGEMAVAVADISRRARDAGGQPLRALSAVDLRKGLVRPG